ncbi:MAG: ATP-binding protein [Oligoflexia bacterium]|nr:ATP-binding protein [Oligoflexia bacterium]
MIKRILTEILSQQLQKIPKSILLLGPRQTGKSTLIKELDPHLTINLAKESVYREHLTDTKLIERQVAGLIDGTNHSNAKRGQRQKERIRIFIDEVQRLPSLLNTVQSIIDDYKQVTFLLTGSSARKLRRGAANLLPGRILQHRLAPLIYWEIRDSNNFDLEKALTIGMLPEIYLEDYGQELLQDYTDIYLREEIVAESIVRNHASYGIFLSVAAKVSGQELNYAKLAFDSEIPKESIRRYVEILDDTLLIRKIPGFTAIQSSRKAIQREKIIFFDLGVRNAILNIHHNHFSSDDYGPLFEQWITLQLLYYSEYHAKKWKLHYYRDDLSYEVDLIVEHGEKLTAIEIKWGKSYKSSWKEGLEHFISQHHKRKIPIQTLIIYRGDSRQKDGMISILPYQTFLTNLEDFLD